MFKRSKRIIGLCVFLAAFFAPAAHAQTIYQDPGAVGGTAQDFSFSAGPEPSGVVDILWSDNKTLEYTSGTHLFLLWGPPCVGYAGVLLDAAGNAIPDAEVAGRTNCTAGSELSVGVIDVPAATVFSGIRLFAGAFNSQNAWQWTWDDGDRPVIGQTQVSGNQPPVPDAGGPYEDVVGTPVTFDASASIDPDGTISSYVWDFGDGTSLGGETIQHTYTNAGKYHVILTVTDNEGLPQSTSTIADIGSVTIRPTADAGGPYTAETSSTVPFDGTGSTDPDNAITQYDWDFGDGSQQSGATPTKAYANAGTYYVVLTVTDATGNADSTVTVATITGGKQAPEADAGPPVEGVAGTAVSFDGSNSIDADGPIAQYDWDFGDGNTGTGATPSHAYAAAGGYAEPTS